ncbi:MAG: TIGR04190 family B12-binding domain/radical SAM domain protein [Acidimicrobiales bacterium]
MARGDTMARVGRARLKSGVGNRTSALRRVFGIDLVLLHAPAVWDFREKVILQGPLADVIPSTDEFEMYPIGLTSIAAYLEANNYNTRIVNLAYRMLRSPRFDVARHLATLDAPIFGIDLHWLPHAHGALGIAELVKQVHPEAKVLIGGLSATYFHEEIIANPAVDFVLRGDSTEEPCRQLLSALRTGTPLDLVENLTFKRPDESVVVNPITFVPSDLDWIEVPAYDFMTHAVFKYRSLADFLPYLEWLRYPSTMLLNARGCTYDCAICGGSRTGYRVGAGRSAAALRSPEKLVADARRISTFSGAPIFMVHDPRIGGIPRARRFFGLFSDARIPNELVIEVFYPAHDDFFSMVRQASRAWSLQITIESPDPDIRRANGKFPVPNTVVEETLASALAHGCGKLDLFFMIGLSGQTPEIARSTIDYCRHLVRRFAADKRLQFYVAPLGPFLDPGSRAYERPELGFHRRFVTLEDHRRALLGPTWREMLSYDTDWMTRDQIVSVTYEVGAALNDLKLEAGLIDRSTHASVAQHFEIARETFPQVDALAGLPDDERPEALRRLADNVKQANTASLVGTDELKWRSTDGFHLSRILLRHTAAALPREIAHGWARLRRHYDAAIPDIHRLPVPSGAPGSATASTAPGASDPITLEATRSSRSAVSRAPLRVQDAGNHAPAGSRSGAPAGSRSGAPAGVRPGGSSDTTSGGSDTTRQYLDRGGTGSTRPSPQARREDV